MPQIGIDEVGRGAWAGPLLVCAVKMDCIIPGLTDSKLINKKKRDNLSREVLAKCEVGFGWVSADEIDDIGLSRALSLAAAKALNEINRTDDSQIVSDGNVPFFPLLNNEKVIVKADLSVPAVSASSIVAKVARDARMAEYDDAYPEYGFSSHVGYGTLQHRGAIKKFGYSPIHRRSYCIKI